MVGRGQGVGCTVRVPAGKRWHTRVKTVQGTFVYKGVGVDKETQEVVQKPRAIILTQPAGNGCLHASCVHMLSHFSRVQLFETPMDCSPPGSSVHGILQARILEWVDMPSSRGSSQPRDQTQVSPIAGGFFTTYLSHQGIQRILE